MIIMTRIQVREWPHRQTYIQEMIDLIVGKYIFQVISGETRQVTGCSVTPNVLFTAHSIFHDNGCRSAWYSNGTVRHKDVTQQEEGHLSFFTCLVARHLIKMLNVLMNDGESCMEKITHSENQRSVYLQDITQHKQPCLIEHVGY